MLFDVVHVRLNELHTQQMTVAPWETPVLKAVHGDEEVVVKDTVDVVRDAPDAEAEYQRLEQRYAVDKDSKVPFVAAVYGRLGAGVQALGAAIKQASKRKSAAA